MEPTEYLIVKRELPAFLNLPVESIYYIRQFEDGQLVAWFGPYWNHPEAEAALERMRKRPN
jgi:hypothetical protein